MHRGLLSVVGVCLLLTVLVPGGAAAAPGDPTSACSEVADSLSDNEKAVVGTTVATDEAMTDEVLFYPGSTLSLVLCRSNGEAIETRGGEGWGLRSHPAIRNTTGRESYWTVEVAATDETAEFADLISNIPEGEIVTAPTIVVQTGVDYDSELGDETLVFRDDDSAARLERNETAFLTSTEAMTENASGLTEIEASNDGPLDDRTVRRVNATLSNVTEATQAMTERKASTQRLLYGHASTGISDGQALTLVQTTNQRERDAREQTRTQLQKYQSTVDERIATARADMQSNLLIGLVVGCLAGVAAGTIRQYRAYNEYTDFRATTKSVSYDRSVLSLPISVGVALLIAGLGLTLFVMGVFP